MTYNPLDNDGLREMIFSYLRTPCEYRKPPHYYVMRPYCIMVRQMGIEIWDCGDLTMMNNLTFF